MAKTYLEPNEIERLVRDAGLANEAGWVPVDRATLGTQYENVYALGDVTAIPIPGLWKPDVPLMLPKAGVFAHGQAFRGGTVAVVGRAWHLGKVLFEQWWLTPFGPRREALWLALQLGGRMFGVPIST